MPQKIDRINDNTFFVLYALSKTGNLDIPCLRFIYQYEQAQDIFAELKRLQSGKKININYNLAPPNIDEQISKNIFDNKEFYESAIKQLNDGEKLDFYNPIMKYLPFATGCSFKLKDTIDKFCSDFERYFEKQEPHNGIYNFNQHHEVIKKYFKTPDGNMLLPNPKIKLSRITEQVKNYDKCYSRYNFWHYFKQLEKDNLIKINNLLIDENEPTIDFTVLNVDKFISQNQEISEQIKTYRGIILYNDKIEYAGKSEKIDRPYKARVIKFVLDNPKGIGNIQRHELAQQIKFSKKRITTATSAANVILRKLLETDDDLIELKENKGDYIIMSIDNYLNE